MALVTGVCLIAFGMNPGEIVAYLWTKPPPWVDNPWTGLGIIVVGLVVIGVTLVANRMDQRQKVLDSLAEDLSWAISNLLNRRAPYGGGRAPRGTESVDDWVERWSIDYQAWCDRVSAKLSNRAFFTRADQLHFDRLGAVPLVPSAVAVNDRHNHLIAMLSLKFDRLRQLIHLVQTRGR